MRSWRVGASGDAVDNTSRGGGGNAIPSAARRRIFVCAGRGGWGSSRFRGSDDAPGMCRGSGRERAPTAVPSPAAFAASSPLVGDLCITRFQSAIPLDVRSEFRRPGSVARGYAKVSVGRGGIRRLRAVMGRGSRFRGEGAFQVPAFAGMTMRRGFHGDGAAPRLRRRGAEWGRDSRLRGNDGKGAGMTVRAAARPA